MYPLPAPRADMAYAGGAVTKEEKPGLVTSKSYGSYNALHAPSLPSYYANYNRPVGSFNHGLDLEGSPTAPQAPYMGSTADSSPSSTSQYLQPMSTSSSMALNAVTGPNDNLPSSMSGRLLPAPIQTEGLAPPASVLEHGRDVSRRSSRSTMRFPQQHMPHSASMTSMHSGFNNTPHGGRRITLTMPVPLDPNTSTDGYMHSRTNSISEFGQYLGGGSPVSTMKSRAGRDSRRSLQPYHQGHLSPHFSSAADEIATLPGGGPVSDPRHQQSSSISTTTAPSSGPSRNGSGSAGSTTGGGTSDSEALMISTAKGKQVDRS
ncbi:hypothetical protein QFC22_005270 [Naganishia vaughanmartiniae]|uniref:Uncharacterized protein n=1 Tax=Naganishia vaughanmartiniae TaxID=1424756 RepID=A0ACC2WWV0_9TREE|nr:hypothetical protein QFC22_005270 [Naganishia vaughanmartiniae]